MEVKIGILNSPREISFESSEAPEAVTAAVAKVLDEKSSILKLSDEKGRQYLVPSSSLAYVEIGEIAARRIGFVS